MGNRFDKYAKQTRTKVKAYPVIGEGEYQVIARSKSEANKFVHEIDLHEGQRPGISGVSLSKPKKVRKFSSVNQLKKR